MNKTFIIIVLVILVFLSAFFSGSETVYSQCNKLKLKKLGEGGDKKAKKAYDIATNFQSLISVILIGNNLVNIAASSLATILFVDLFESNGALYAGFIVTGIILIFGEILPKTIFPSFNLFLVKLFTTPIELCNFIFSPLVKIILKLLGKLPKAKEEKEDDELSTGELITMVDEIEESGYIDNETKELVNSAINLKDTVASEIMTPRVDLFAFDINDDYKTLLKDENIFTYSRVLVYNDNIDDIVGVINTRNLILKSINKQKINISEMLVEPIYVHKSKSLTSILRVFKQTHTHIAIVVDEFGGTLGIITLEDLLEEVVGDIWDEMDEENEEAETIASDTYIIDGDMNIFDFLELIELSDDEYESLYQTVGGLCTELLGDFPKVGDSIDFYNYKITILEVDKVRVEKVRVERILID